VVGSDLGFRFLGGVSRRVFIPPRLSEIASSAETKKAPPRKDTMRRVRLLRRQKTCLLARTDRGRCLSSILSLRGHDVYDRGNLGLIFTLL